jgi:hypothetical protein
MAGLYVYSIVCLLKCIATSLAHTHTHVDSTIKILPWCTDPTNLMWRTQVINFFIGLLLHVLAVCKLSPGNSFIIYIRTDYAELDILYVVTGIQVLQISLYKFFKTIYYINYIIKVIRCNVQCYNSPLSFAYSFRFSASLYLYCVLSYVHHYISSLVFVFILNECITAWLLRCMLFFVS